MSQLRVLLQESAERERGSSIIRLLREQMETIGGERRRRTLKEIMSFGCCGGAPLEFRSSSMREREDDDGDDGGEGEIETETQQVVEIETVESSVQIQTGGINNGTDPGCTETVAVSSGMNLAAALAAERDFRAAEEPEIDVSVGPTSNGIENVESTERKPSMSLMRLLEEADCGGDAEEEKIGGVVGNDSVCCVCMGRKKGAAFIPCGHTFCRVCSREVWLNRGSCPLCNRSILEILDIF